MSDCYASQVDFLSLSFQSVEIDSNDEELYQEGAINVYELMDYLLSLLEQSGMVSPSFSERSLGYHGYSASFDIFRPGVTGRPVRAGILAFTPAGLSGNAGFYFSLSGDGCLSLDFQNFLSALQPFSYRITRLDLAIDYYEGEINLDDIKRYYLDGLFRGIAGRSPQHSSIEPKTQEGGKVSGFTFYVGVRGNPKFSRAYEKGLCFESGNPFSRWVRLELEIRRNNNFEINKDFIYDKDAFLASIYPRLFKVLPFPSHSEDSDFTNNLYRSSYTTPDAQVSIHHLLKHARNSYGSLVRVLLTRLNYTPEQIVEALLHDDPEKVPPRLIQPLLPEDVTELNIDDYFEQDFLIISSRSKSTNFYEYIGESERIEKYKFFTSLLEEHLEKMSLIRSQLTYSDPFSRHFDEPDNPEILTTDEYKHYLRVCLDCKLEIKKLYPIGDYPDVSSV